MWLTQSSECFCCPSPCSSRNLWPSRVETAIGHSSAVLPGQHDAPDLQRFKSLSTGKIKPLNTCSSVCSQSDEQLWLYWLTLKSGLQTVT